MTELTPAWMQNSEKTDLHFNPRPDRCPICGGKVEYGRMEDFGINPYQSGMCYYCPDCGAYVATHRKRPKDALGELGTREERSLRVECHSLFDSLYYSTRGRNAAYFALSEALGIRQEDCHFGYMHKEMLDKAMKVLTEWIDKGVSF